MKKKCPNCYSEYDLPAIRRTICQITYSPTEIKNKGLFKGKCKCNQRIPFFHEVGKRGFVPVCPNCNKELFAIKSKQHFIQVLGGDQTGKTSLIAAFQHIVSRENNNFRSVILKPDDIHNELETNYLNGITVESSKTDVPPVK